MRGASVHFDLRGQLSLAERLFQNVLLIGRPRVVIRRDCDEETAPCFAPPEDAGCSPYLSRVRRHGMRQPRPPVQAQRPPCRNAIGLPMQYPCVPIFRFFATDACPSSQPMKAFASVICVVSFRPCASGKTCWIGVAEPASAVGAFLTR